MTTTVLNVPAGVTGGIVQTEYGNYAVSDGQVTVDSRVVTSLLGAGFQLPPDAAPPATVVAQGEPAPYSETAADIAQALVDFGIMEPNIT